MALPSGSLLKAQTPLQQLLEDINFQRTKEMRQLLKDDSGFVVLQGTTYWTDLFVRHFLFQSEPVHSIDSDDLLFFVRKKHVKSSSRSMPKYETEVDVYRKDSRKLPIGDPDVDWEETVYLNMVIHQFDYTLTLAICTRTSPKELQVLRRHSQRVYASPSRRKMDTKGEGEEMTYPHICYMVDNFDEVFSDILVRDGEMVCVELVANDKDGSVQGVIFLGSIRYDALKKVYDARQSSLSSKVAQRMSFGLFSSGAGVQTRCEFVRMKGPQGKGHAEMAVTKPKGSGVETPTSEPGFCATDMWDDWDEDPDDYYNYRHQRRLSDPSANLNNFARYGWKAKNSQQTNSAGSKARSENEGLDSLANEVSEIEAGDLRDDLRPAFSASEIKLNARVNIVRTTKTTTATTKKTARKKLPINEHDDGNHDNDDDDDDKNSCESPTKTTKCSSCFGRGRKSCKCWSSSASTSGSIAQMSDIYCPISNYVAADDDVDNNDADDDDDDKTNSTPACLNNMPNKKMKSKPKTILSIESEFIVSDNNISSLTASTNDKKKSKVILTNQKKEKTIMRDKKIISDECCNKSVSNISSNNNMNAQEYEIADDATSLNGSIDLNCEKSSCAKIAILSEDDTKSMINVRGKEELPVVEESPMPLQSIEKRNNEEYQSKLYRFEKCVPVKSEFHPLQTNIDDDNDEISVKALNNESKCSTPCSGNKREKIKNTSHLTQRRNSIEISEDDVKITTENTPILNDLNGNRHNGSTKQFRELVQISSSSGAIVDNVNNGLHRVSTLPRLKKTSIHQNFYDKALRMVPKRRTPDGTNIYYWCDLPKKALKELDDGAYNPLWATRGFTQTFHFWKENRRQQSTPLNAFLTYVTLPWWSIAKDLLDHRETPILTF